METFTITTALKDAFPLPRTYAEGFKRIKNDELPSDYNVSLVFVGDDQAQELNKSYRKKTYVPNVLSFPLDETTGEIFINVEEADREAQKMGVSLEKRLAELFIHGLLHLKGHEHGSTMESEEDRLIKVFE